MAGISKIVRDGSVGLCRAVLVEDGAREVPGEFTIRAEVGDIKAESVPFEVRDDAIFASTADLCVDFFFVQRCGFAVPGWHAACHMDDAKLPDGSHRDLTGGWHSAGAICRPGSTTRRNWSPPIAGWNSRPHNPFPSNWAARASS